MSEIEENIVVTLVDENDESFDAELLDSIQYDGRIYNLFIPVPRHINGITINHIVNSFC